MCTGSAFAVSEIVRLVDHDQVIVPPIQAIQIQPVGCAAVSRQIRVEQHDVIIPIGVPVGSQLLGAENQNRFVPVFVILDDSKRGKRFAQTNTVRQNAAIVFFELVDNRKDSIALKIIEHAPDFALLEAGRLIRQNVLRNIVKEFAEHMV